MKNIMVSEMITLFMIVIKMLPSWIPSRSKEFVSGIMVSVQMGFSLVPAGERKFGKRIAMRCWKNGLELLSGILMAARRRRVEMACRFLPDI